MMQVEITKKATYTEEERYKILLHSFYNIMTVLRVDLTLLDKIIGQSDGLRKCFDIYNKLMSFVEDPQKHGEQIRNIEDYTSNFRENITRTIEQAKEEAPEKVSFFYNTVDSLKKVLDIINVRTREFIFNIDNTGNDKWQRIDIAEISDKLRFVFEVIGEKSRNNNVIVFDKEQPAENEYSIFFSIVSADNSAMIYMPPFFQDVLRDLTANSRKYSMPSTVIRSSLYNDGEYLILRVKDEGRGIPESEIEKVVEMGYRASNTTAEETYGDGFGLTKAWLMCNSYDGRMWIDSALGRGTEITIKIPVPR